MFSQRFTLVLSAILLAAVAVALVAASQNRVNQGKTDEVQKQFDDMKEAFNNLADENRELTDELKGLKDEHRDLKKDFEKRFQEINSKLECFKVKDVKLFYRRVRIDTTNVISKVPLEFDEPVEQVFMHAFLNDGHDLYHCVPEKQGDGKTWIITLTHCRGKGVRWIPAVAFIGIRIIR